MPLDALAGKLTAETRQQLHDMFLLWWLVRNPEADTRPGGEPDIDANVWSDAGSLILSKALIIANGVSRTTATGDAVDVWCSILGTQREGAVGAGGEIVPVFASTGGQVVTGDILEYQPTGLKYQVLTQTGVYPPGTPIQVAGVDTGAQTDLPAGAVLSFVTLRPGVNAYEATVTLQADGSGLSGGAPAESDEACLARLQDIASNPPASGNDAQYRGAVTSVAGIAVQAAFTIPAVQGPGTTGLMFTLRPGTPGANRIPTPGQMATVLSIVGGQMPGSDGIYPCSIVAFPVDTVLQLSWNQGFPGWTDSTLFPLYHPSPNLVIATPNSAGVLSPTAFRLSSAAMTEVPQSGQNIGFLDKPSLVFRRKKILSVAVVSATQYDILVDTTTSDSDTSYTPLSGQSCCPWSDSLDTLVTPVVTYFDVLGPGEQFDAFFDPGIRQRRLPQSPQFWPNVLTTRLLGGTTVPQAPQGPQQNQPAVPVLYNLPALFNVDLLEPHAPFPTPVGIPGVSSNMQTLRSLVAFPDT